MAASLCYMSLFALGICALTAIVSYKEKRILAAAAAGVFGFFAEYTIIGGMLFLFDVFSVTASLLIIAGVDAAGLSVLWIKKRKAPFRGMRLSVSRLGLFFIFAALILSFGKFGYYGMAQDQGVYQVRAIDIMYSSPQCLKTFGEYDTLSPQQQEEYRSYIYGILGYDEYVSTLPTLSEEEKPNGVSGFFHGIPTYPAILALWGNMFGMQNMLGVNSLFFLGLIITALYLCEELKLDTVSTAIAMSLLTFSPIVIWVAKSSLTELFLAYIVIMFMYLALHNDRLYIILSAMPLVTFAFFHITVYTSLPLYMLIYIVLYLRTDKKEYIAAALIYSAGFIVGFTMMIFTSPPYVAKNTINPFTRVFGELVEKYGGERTLLLLIYMMAVFFATFAVMCLCCKAVREKLKKLFSGSRLCAAYRVFGAAMLALCIYNLKDLAHINQSPLVALIYVTGFVIFPAVLFLMFRRTKQLLEQDAGFVLLSMFMYLILFRAAILAKNVSHYYYYCRYLAPFIIIIALMAGMLITGKYIKRIAVVSAALLTLPFDAVLVTQKDDTKMQWSMITEVCDIIDSDDAVVIGRKNLLGHLLLHPIKEIAGAAVFPEFECTSLSDQLKQLDEQYDTVYLIYTTEQLSQELDGLSVVYKSTIESSEDIKHEKRATSWFALPLYFTRYKRPITIYRFSK